MAARPAARPAASRLHTIDLDLALETMYAADMREQSTRPPTLGELRAKRDEILRVAAAHRVTNIRVFGSVARGDADRKSDIDFIVDLPPDAGGFCAFGLLEDLRRDLEAVVGTPVDVVTLSASSRERGRRWPSGYSGKRRGS